jgi:hypothetical protein
VIERAMLMSGDIKLYPVAELHRALTWPPA